MSDDRNDNQAAATGAPLLCFIHIEKAAGMTLHAVFRNNWPLSYLTLTPFHLWSNEPGSELGSHELRRLLRWLPPTRGIGGHTTRSYIDYEGALRRPVQYVTFLREPVSRYISHFNYQRDVMGKEWSVEAFLREKRFDNYMTRRLAGAADAAKAKAQLDRYLTVGLLDRFDESLVLLRSAIGLRNFDIRYEKVNTSRVRGYERAEELREERIQQRIRERNALDMEVYEYARDMLYPAQVSRFEGDLRHATEQAVSARADFRFPRARKLAWTAYRHLAYRHVERLANRSGIRSVQARSTA